MNGRRKKLQGRPLVMGLLGAVAIVMVVLGITSLGTSTSSAARTSTEAVEAENGVVQTTVSESGDVEPGVDEDVNFATSGTLQHLYVKVGQQVTKGQLLATLSPTDAELQLKAAKATLAVAEDQLTAAEDALDEADDTAYDATASASDLVDYTTTDTTTDTTPTTASTTTTPETTTTTSGTTTSATKTTTSDSKTTGTKTTGTDSDTSSDTDSDSTDDSTSGESSAEVKAQDAEQVASDEVQVDSDKQTVQSDQEAVTETKLYAPVSGDIAALPETALGTTVASGSDSAVSDSSSDESDDDVNGDSDSSDSSSAFAEIINSTQMTMTVSVDASDISSIKDGQIASVSFSDLNGVELAGHVSSVSLIGTTSDDVTSYDATITITQHNSKVLAGMSGTATIVTKQASGVTLPTAAITGSGTTGYVELDENGKKVRTEVVVGLRGTERAEVVSGVKAGQDVYETVSLPSLGTSTTSTTSSSTATKTFGGGGFTGGGAFFREGGA